MCSTTELPGHFVGEIIHSNSPELVVLPDLPHALRPSSQTTHSLLNFDLSLLSSFVNTHVEPGP